MRKAAVCFALLFLVALLPSLTFTEDQATVRLARTIYALARDESYETKLAIATVALNRVDSPWHERTLEEVLSSQHQFPAGEKYDAESLKAAHAAVAGKRNLPKSALYYQAADAKYPWTRGLVKTIGGFRFYTEDGNF